MRPISTFCVVDTFTTAGANRAVRRRDGHGRCHGVLRRLGGRRLRDSNGGQASGQNSDGNKRTNDL
jgi:hypothetical protein